METVSGELLEAGTTRLIPAEIGWDGACMVIAAAGVREGFAAEEITVSDHVAGAPARLQLPRGMVFVTGEHDRLSSLLKAAGLRRRGMRLGVLERWHPRLLAVLVALVAATVVVFKWGVPFLALVGSSVFPHDLERRMGAQAFATVDDLLLEPSQLSRMRRSDIRSLYAGLLAQSDLPGEPELHFRSGPIGPNALAFPGGPVVITDAMVALAGNDDAIAGVLSHELGHIAERHSLQRLILATGTALLVAVAVGDIGEVLEEAAVLPTLLLDSAHSRAFERDADGYALTLMRATGRDPAALAGVFETLRAQCGGDCSTGWLSSHPPLAERVQRLQ